MKGVFLSLIAVLLSVSSLSAATIDRTYLGFIDTAEGYTQDKNLLHNNVEMVLNHLGVKLDIVDISKGYPKIESLDHYAGLITWFETSIKPSVGQFWQVVDAVLESGKPVVMIDQLPRTDLNLETPVNNDDINQILGKLGVEIGAGYSSIPFGVTVEKIVSGLMEFERPLGNELTNFFEARSVDPRNKVWLRLARKAKNEMSDAVIVAPNGGVVLGNYAMYSDPVSEIRQWRIDPFVFFEKALGLTDMPRMDVTSLNGTRLFYTHVDGDGLNNASYIDGPSDSVMRANPISGKVLLDEVYRPMSHIPFTLSVIIAEVDPKIFGSKESLKVARAMFALPNVEVASHTFSHPLVWDRKLVKDEVIKHYSRDYSVRNIQNDALLPWRIRGYRFSPEKEVKYSVNYINQFLVPPGKKCSLVLWSGNCLPNEATHRVLAENGLLNLNGGDSQFDGDHPSYRYMAPLYRKIGPYYQIYTSAANENLYTNLWTDTFGGFQNVIATFENSESPRRIAPINVYYHHYSGQYEASVFAVKKVYDWVYTQRVFPIFTSRYVRIVNGFISAKIDQIADRRWRITDNGECRTVRFDRVKDRVDMAQSKGVLGFYRYQGSLYVHLDDSNDHLIVLSAKKPSLPYLRWSEAEVDDVVVSQTRVAYTTSVFGKAKYSWYLGNAFKKYGLRIVSDGKVTETTVRSNWKGAVEFEVDTPGKSQVELMAKS